MKLKLEKKYAQLGITLFLTAIAIMLAYFLFFRIEQIKSGISSLNGILAPIFYGFVLAYLMTPLLNGIEKKGLYPFINKHNLLIKDKKRNRHVRLVSVLITLIIVLLFLYLFFASVIPQIYLSIQNLVSHYSVYTNNLVNWVNKTLDMHPEIAEILSDIINDYSSEADDFLNDIVLPTVQSFLLPNIDEMLTSLSASIMKVIGFIWNIVIGLIISIYVLSSKERFSQGMTRFCYAFMDVSSANKFLSAIRFTHKTFIGFLGGKILDSAIIGVICYFSCLILKIPYAVLIGVVIGVTNVIPIVGPYIGAIPSTIIILLVDPKKALTFIIFILILQQFDGNFLGPKILSQSTGLSSFWIIFSITLFGGLFGIIGMIIGVPVTAVIASGIETITKAHLSKKNLPLESDDYYNIGNITSEGVLEQIKEEEISNHKMKNPEDKASFIKKLTGFFQCIIKKFKRKKNN